MLCCVDACPDCPGRLDLCRFVTPPPALTGDKGTQTGDRVGLEECGQAVTSDAATVGRLLDELAVAGGVGVLAHRVPRDALVVG